MARNSARKKASAKAKAEPTLIAGNVKIHDRRTSVRLEPEMWSALNEIASMESMTIHGVCSAVDDCKLEDESFSSALRVFLLKYYRDVARGNIQLEKTGNERKSERGRWPVLRPDKDLVSGKDGQDARG